ncbi:MAG: D-alanyl-D-alanine carboxypeptidase/D-alanyl-D-alanine-endopeptidase [Planctomycetota bacterium]
MIAIRIVFVIAVAALACMVDAQLAAELRRAVANAGLGKDGIAGVAVRDASTGEIVFETNADVPLAPASNQKLLTSAAAVLLLGPDYAFTTEIAATGDGSTLVLRSNGDPAFGDTEVLKELDPPLTPDDALDQFAAGAVGAAPIGRVAQLVVDDRVFDREGVHADWPRDQLERWYCAPVRGVNINSNVLAFYPSPAAGGGGVVAPIEPHADWVEVTDRADVVREGRNAVWIQRSETDDAYAIRGSIRTRAQSPIEVSLREPSLFTGRLIAERLANAGVEFAAPAPAASVRLAEPNETIDTVTVLARWTTPLDEVLYRTNHDSMNVHAEALLKTLGRAVTGEQGTWRNGTAVLRMLIAEKLGPAAVSTTTIRDGSGLSRENRISAGTLSAWLVRMHADADAQAMYRATLPTAEGKLARRFKLGSIDHSVYAKTGTINRVRCLSGYVTNETTGQTAAFSILLNGLSSGQSIRAANALHGELVELIDDHIHEFVIPAVEQPALGG